MKLLCIGNSITFHPVKEDIGWTRACGMAASAPEKDYAHVLATLLRESGKQVELLTENAADWERDPSLALDTLFEKEKKWNADVLVVRLSENVPSDKRDAFLKAYERMLRFFKKDDRRIFCVGAFWENDAMDAAFEEIALRNGCTFVSLKSVQGEAFRAIGQYANPDVSHHPSDAGMEGIAKLIFAAMQKEKIAGGKDIPLLPAGEQTTDAIRMTVDGKPVAVRTCRVSKAPINWPWPGHQRPLDQTEIAYFVCVGVGAGADISVTFDVMPEQVTVRPSRLGLPVRVSGNTISFTVRRPGYYTVEGAGRHGVLHILASPTLFRDADKSRYTYYYGPGEHEIGKLKLKSGESIYIDADAVVYGSLYAKEAENIRICGGGILDGSHEERHTPVHWAEDGLVNLIDCRRVLFEGITLRDSCWWNISLYRCEDISFDWIKLIGEWRYNTDGIDTINSSRVCIRHSFIRNYDDSLVFKGLRVPGMDLESHNVTDCLAEDCTLWCDWGGAVELGAETIADEYYGLVFRNIDILRNSDGALRIHSGDRAVIHDITYENIYVEYTPYDYPQVLQKAEEETYPENAVSKMPAAIRGWMVCNVWTHDGIMGKIHDMTYRGIHIVADKALTEREDFDANAWIWIEGRDGDRTVDRVKVENFTVNGKEIVPHVRRNSNVTITVNGVDEKELP